MTVPRRRSSLAIYRGEELMTKQRLTVALLALLAATSIAGCKPKAAANEAANTASADSTAAQTNASLAAWNAAANTANDVTTNAAAQ